MRQQNFRGTGELPPSAEVREKSLNEAADSQQERKHRTRRRLNKFGKVAVTSLLILDVHVTAYVIDVHENMVAADEAQSTIGILDEAPDETTAQKANVYFHGFNTFNADDLVHRFGHTYQEDYGGENWSIQYNNAVLDSAKLSTLVLDRFEKEETQQADFISYSMGDDPMMNVAVDTVANTDIDVQNITIMSGPADYDTLTDATKEQLAIAKSLAWVPWIEYSTPFRYALEAYFYRDNFERDPIEALDGMNIRINRGDMTTNRFLASQINSIANLDVPSKIKEIAEYADTKHMPNINVIVIKDEKDTVVDNARSAEKICKTAEEVGLNCTVTSVDSTHGGYWSESSLVEYTNAFTELAPIDKEYTVAEVARVALNEYYRDRLQTYAQDNPFKLDTDTTDTTAQNADSNTDTDTDPNKKPDSPQTAEGDNRGE